MKPGQIELNQDYRSRHDALEAEYFTQERLEPRALRGGKSLLEFARLHRENSRDHFDKLIEHGYLNRKRVYFDEDRV